MTSYNNALLAAKVRYDEAQQNLWKADWNTLQDATEQLKQAGAELDAIQKTIQLMNAGALGTDSFVAAATGIDALLGRASFGNAVINANAARNTAEIGALGLGALDSLNNSMNAYSNVTFSNPSSSMINNDFQKYADSVRGPINDYTASLGLPFVSPNTITTSTSNNQNSSSRPAPHFSYSTSSGTYSDYNTGNGTAWTAK